MTEADFVRLLSTANCISWQEIEAPITAKAPRSRDGAVVEGSHVAARLGLPVDRLRTEMRRGRYRARAWTVVVPRDGTLSKAP